MREQDREEKGTTNSAPKCNKQNMRTKARVYIFRYLCIGQYNHLIHFCQNLTKFTFYFLRNQNKLNATKKIGFTEDKSQLQSDIDAPL